MNVEPIPRAQILVSDRLRAIDEDWARLLSESLSSNGQRSPIEVLPPNADGFYRLISGAHRVRAAEILGLPTLDAVVMDVSADEAQLLEADENLMRHELTELDRSYFLARRKEAFDRIFPPAKKGANQYTLGFVKSDKPSRFTHDAAEKLGVSEAVIQRAIKRFHKMAPGVREAITGTRVAKVASEIDALVRRPEGQQLAIAELIKAGARTVADARSQYEKRPVIETTPEQRHRAALIGAWTRADDKLKQDFIKEFVAPWKKGARQ